MRFESTLRDYTGEVIFRTMTLSDFRAFRERTRGKQTDREKTPVDIGLFYEGVDEMRYITLDDLTETIRQIDKLNLVGPDGEELGMDCLQDDSIPYAVAIWLIICYGEWLGRSLSFFRTGSRDLETPNP